MPPQTLALFPFERACVMLEYVRLGCPFVVRTNVGCGLNWVRRTAVEARVTRRFKAFLGRHAEAVSVAQESAVRWEIERSPRHVVRSGLIGDSGRALSQTPANFYSYSARPAWLKAGDGPRPVARTAPPQRQRVDDLRQRADDPTVTERTGCRSLDRAAVSTFKHHLFSSHPSARRRPLD
jgi:hypothetical protein